MDNRVFQIFSILEIQLTRIWNIEPGMLNNFMPKKFDVEWFWQSNLCVKAYFRGLAGTLKVRMEFLKLFLF